MSWLLYIQRLSLILQVWRHSQVNENLVHVLITVYAWPRGILSMFKMQIKDVHGHEGPGGLGCRRSLVHIALDHSCMMHEVLCTLKLY